MRKNLIAVTLALLAGLLFAQNSPNADSDKQLAAAAAKIGAGDFAGATAILEKVVVADPGNKLAWRQQWGELCYAGSTVTAGGLLFIGRNDGRLSALDKSNGAQLWEFQTDAGIHAAVSTFERNGKQYVVALSAGSFFPNTTRGDSVWLFALDGAGVPSGPSGEPSGGATELAH